MTNENYRINNRTIKPKKSKPVALEGDYNSYGSLSQKKKKKLQITYGVNFLVKAKPSAHDVVSMPQGGVVVYKILLNCLLF